MTGIYYDDMVDVLIAAGCKVKVPAVCNGWETRARSSGGFPSPPLGNWWHHTASDTDPLNDLGWMIDGSDDAPIGNWLLDRDGYWYPIAAGASNCAGKGGPWTFSRGTAAADSGNTRGWQTEVCNAGTGQAWPQVQIDAYFRGSNALNALVGNQPGDCLTHHGWAEDRKIDPATAAAVQGPWKPRSINSSGTWNLDDICNEATRRAGNEEDEVTEEQMSELVERTAKAVWQYGLTDEVSANKSKAPAGDHLRLARRDSRYAYTTSVEIEEQVPDDLSTTCADD